MSQYPEIFGFLKELQESVESEQTREIKDSHDYSSSDYSAFDAGRNDGVSYGLEAFIEKLMESVKECTSCGKASFHEDGDYTCVICREQEYESRQSDG